MLHGAALDRKFGQYFLPLCLIQKRIAILIGFTKNIQLRLADICFLLFKYLPSFIFLSDSFIQNETKPGFIRIFPYVLSKAKQQHKHGIGKFFNHFRFNDFKSKFHTIKPT